MGNTIVREIIKIRGWKDGSGWSYTTEYSDQTIAIAPTALHDFDWDWWEVGEEVEGEDLQISVQYFDADADPDVDCPIAEHTIMESELRQ